VVAGVLALVLMPLATPTASAAPSGSGTPRAAKSFTLSMVEGEGTLTLRGGEPRQLENPTSVSGTVDAADPEALDTGTGAVTNGSFTTPEMHIQQRLTAPPDPVTATVYIDATFTQVTPGNLTGTVDAEGTVTLSTALRVDLHVEVGRNPTLITTDCSSSPVNLTLGSPDGQPWNPETGQVTLSNGNFTIPEFGNCEANVQGAINEQLAGPGHAISLALEGDLPLPENEREKTITDLVVTPEGGTRVGQDVTLAATVAPGPDVTVDDDPTGIVEFRDGAQVLDTIPLEADGTAELVTDRLGAGTLSLTARYLGDPVFGRSGSDPVTHVVSANPALTWDLPSTVELFGAPTDFTVEATNTGLGRLLANTRLDVTLQRAQGTQNIAPVGTDPRIVLEQVDGDTVTPIPLTVAGTGSNQTLTWSIGAGTGVPLAPGTTLEEMLRLTFPNVGTASPTACGNTNRLCPGPLKVTFAIQLVDPGTGAITDTVASETGQTVMVEAARRVATIAAGNVGIPPVVPPIPAISPHTVRAGNNISLNALFVGPNVGGVGPTGTMSFSIDGTPVGVLPPQAGLSAGYQLSVACCSNPNYSVPVPRNIPAGAHTLELRYSGNDMFLPAINSFTFQVAPSLGPIYECERTLLGVSYVGRANVVVQGSLPATVAAGDTVPVSHPTLRMLLDRGPSVTNALNEVVSEYTGIEVVYNVDGTSTSTGATRTNNTRMTAAGDPDQVIELPGLAMAVTIDGDPGEVVPVTIEEFRITFDGIGAALTCKPLGDTALVDTVTVAGTTLSVTPGGPVRSGAAVTLEAAAAPFSGGVVEFRDGTDTIGVVPVNAEGEATMVTTALAAGERSLTARYFGGFAVPSTTSDVVALTVVPIDCAPFVGAGNGNVVRLVYMDLLHRCPDQAGFDHWKARLDTGTPRAVFARAISSSAEARGVIVDDAYEMMLGRQPDVPGRAYWVQWLGENGRYDALVASLGGSEEFWRLAGSTDEGFVERVYQRILLRAADPDGLAYWVGRLEGGMARRALVSRLVNLDEPLGRLVDDSYAEILDGVPTSAERSEGIAYLRATGSRSGLHARLIGSQAFQDRAQGLPNFD